MHICLFISNQHFIADTPSGGFPLNIPTFHWGWSKTDNNSPESHAVFGVVEALNSPQEVRQRVLRVPADQRNMNPRSEERRLGAPALLREISAGGAVAAQQQEERHGGEAGGPVHRGCPMTERGLRGAVAAARGELWKTETPTFCGHHKAGAAASDVA